MKSIAGKYGFASGSGGWGTTMTVASDGTFSGTYHDSDMGITGDDYPNGSVTISNFKGRFKDAKKNADGSYTMQCDKSALKIDGNIGDTYIKNGSKYTVADPYGIALAVHSRYIRRIRQFAAQRSDRRLEPCVV